MIFIPLCRIHVFLRLLPALPAAPHSLNTSATALTGYYSLNYLHPKSLFLFKLVESPDVSSQVKNPSLSLHLHFLCYHTFATP